MLTRLCYPLGMIPSTGANHSIDVFALHQMRYLIESTPNLITSYPLKILPFERNISTQPLRKIRHVNKRRTSNKFFNSIPRLPDLFNGQICTCCWCHVKTQRPSISLKNTEFLLNQKLKNVSKKFQFNKLKNEDKKEAKMNVKLKIMLS